MAEQSSKKIIFTLTGILIFISGLVAAKVFSRFLGISDPVIARFDGKVLYEREVLGAMAGGENSPEYKKQISLGLIRTRTIADLAAKEGLTSGAFIQRVKAGADIRVKEEELEQFLSERHFIKAKLSKPQLDNILANIREQKREVFFNKYINGILATQKIEWLKN